MKDARIPSHQVDVVEIMKKIRQSAGSNRAEMSTEEKVRREAKSEFLGLIQNAQVPDYLVEQIRQQTFFEPYNPKTLVSSARPGLGSIIGLIRLILRPIFKLFVNLDPLAHEVNRLSILNNFYLKTIQDLITKTAAMRVEIHAMKRRTGHHHPRENNNNNNNYSRYNNHRRHRHSGGGGGGGRRDAGNNPRPRPVPSTEEPQAQ